MRNFNFPYFSRDIAEFWRRWHISLTTWFRDYIYIPLGGSRTTKAKVIRNTFIIFLVSGFWHGANWTFMAWGAYHALLFLPLILLGKNRKYTNDATWREIPQMLLTFGLAVIGWIIFRIESITDFIPYLKGMWQFGTLRASYRFFTMASIRWTSGFIIIMLIIEWINRNQQHGLQRLPRNVWMRWLIYILIFGCCYYQLLSGEQMFIYFQF